MKTRGSLVCACVLAVGCAGQGPTPPHNSDATEETADAAGDMASDAIDETADAGDVASGVTGEIDGARELEGSTNAPDAATNGQDASATADAADEAGAFNPATWTNIYSTLLDNMSYASNCTGEGCHNPGIQLGFDLSSRENGYATVQAKLVPGDPSGSKIVGRLEAGDMPRGGRPKMPAGDIDLIKMWIRAGAPND
jgi:hypothetical protein